MAEEHPPQYDENISHDDMSVLRVLMREVRGLNAMSLAPVFVPEDPGVETLAVLESDI